MSPDMPVCLQTFQFTLPCGERLRCPECRSKLTDFNSRSLAGSDGSVFASSAMVSMLFQFTLPCGERRAQLLRFFNLHNFNSRSLAGSDGQRDQTSDSAQDFNSRSLAGSDEAYSLAAECRNISIHAPLRGATRPEEALSLRPEFQFTLPCGERPCYFGGTVPHKYFNSRSLAGSDGISECFCNIFSNISIHAPLRGATCSSVIVISCLLFQFTLPCGERLQVIANQTYDSTISIHAPLRGATFQ